MRNVLVSGEWEFPVRVYDGGHPPKRTRRETYPLGREETRASDRETTLGGKETSDTQTQEIT